MKDQILKLVEIQGIDHETEKVRADVARCQKKVAETEEKLEYILQHLARERETKAELEKSQRELNSEAADIQALSKKSQERLNNIKNNRELKALQKEIADGKRRIAEIDDETIACIEKIEELDKTIAGLEDEEKALLQAVEQERECACTLADESDARLAALCDSRSKAAEALLPDLFTRYQLILKAAGGTAVVAVQSAVCLGCNMKVPPQAYNELQRCEDIRQCPHCERIIYWKQEE